MKRYLDITMKLIPIRQGDLFEEFMEFLRDSNAEVEYLYDDVIIYLQYPIKKLFKYKECFEWMSGYSYLWYKDKPVTIENYKGIYWTKIKDAPPVIKEEINN